MEAMIDLNSRSGFVYGGLSAVCDVGVRINTLIDAALEAAARARPRRDYLGGSRIGEPCARRLAYELTPVDDGKEFDGRLLRIFDAGHQFEDLTIRWLQAAGFDLRTRGRDGRQYGFSVAGGRLRGHIDGVVVTGPDVGIIWPALFEHKALKQSSWTDLVKHGLRRSKPVYFAQCQLYLAYMQLEVALFTAMNKDTQELYHEVVPFDPAEAQKLSDKAVGHPACRRGRRAAAPDRDQRGLLPLPDVPLRPALLGGPMSGSFTPSDLQARAIRAINDWFLHRTEEQQVFRVFGYAGVGKTSITSYAIDELGLDTMAKGADGIVSGSDGVLYAAFTGKAALVMTRKGTPASTIHSLIYRVSEARPDEIERVKQEIAEIRAKLPALDPAVRLFEESRLRSLEIRLDDIHKPRFVFNEQSIVRDAALIVLDEVSMVGDDMARDLLAFGKPILVLGDPGQLPPIKGEGAFTKAAPDVMLTEIHRQAGESAIIRLATMARQGLTIPYGKHDAYVWKMPRHSVTPPQMLRGGQVICGRNATRIQLNIAMKRAAGFNGVYPTGEPRNGQPEKIICLKNRHDLGIVNGMFLELSDVRDENEICFSASIRTEDGDSVGGTDSEAARYVIYKGHFDDHVQRDPERDRRDHWIKKGLIEAVWGYAITCHKAQGSQWENVIVYDDGLGRTAEDRARWLYTAITRAEQGLVILD